LTPKNSRPAITVRGQEAADWEGIAAIRNDPSVIYHTLQIPYLSRDAVREHLENPPADFYALVAIIDDQVVGLLGLHIGAGRRAHVARLGMMVRADFQGRGVGTALMEAALELAENWLNISRIELEVYPDNGAALALYEKFGFEIEGTLRDFAYRNGRFVDAYRMARIRQTTVN
jgi:putative acetyltransferase